jgi:hypothetical protein
MRAHRHSIIALLAAVCLIHGADAAERMTTARQDYTYDPRARTVTLALTTVYTGRDADMFRAFYRRIGQDGYSRAKLDYYRGMYGTIAETMPPDVKDDTDRDVMEARERYAISLARRDDDDFEHRFPIYPDLLRGFFSQLPPTIGQPYPLDGTLNRRDVVTVTAPTLGTYAIQDGGVADDFFAFTRKASASPGRVEMDYRLRFLADRVPPETFARYSADIARMDHNIFAWIDLDRNFSRRSYADLPEVAGGLVAALLATAAGGWLLLCARRRRVGRAERN